MENYFNLSSLDEHTEESDNETPIDYRKEVTNTYSDGGLLLSTFEKIDEGADGVFDYSIETSNTYSDDGLLLSTVEEQDYLINGVLDYRTEIINTYDDDSLLSTVEEIDYDADGVIDFSKEVTDTEYTPEPIDIVNTYSDDGLLLSTVKKYDDGLVESVESITYTYDEDGLLLYSNTVYKEYKYQDDTIDYYRELTDTYNDDGLVVSTIEESYDDRFWSGLLKSQESTVSNYNSQGLLLSTSTFYQLHQREWGSNNRKDREVTTINTYDDNGLLLSETNIDKTDYFADGTFEEITITTNTNNNTYDDNGLLISETNIFETDYSEDGNIGYRSITTDSYTYDNDGLLISTATVTEVDENADGIIDYNNAKENITNTYDDNGLLVSTLYEEFYPYYEAEHHESSIKYYKTTTNAYDDDELLISTVDEEVYTNGDIRNRESTTNAYNDDELLLSRDTLYEEKDYDEDNFRNARRESITNTYNDDGILISTTTVKEDDYSDDGIFDSRNEITENYNELGLLISTTTIEEYDYDDDIFDSRTITLSINTYSDEGLLLSTDKGSDHDEDGTIDDDEIARVTTNSYDDDGLLILSITGGVGYRSITTNTYDNNGSLLSTLVLGDGGIREYNFSDGEIDWREQTLYSQETNYVPTVVNSIADITVDEDAPNQTIDLSDVFEDIDSDTIELSVDNSNSELVNPVLNQNDLTLDFLEYQSGTADISIIGTADGQPGEKETFTVTVNPITIELYRFNNTTTDTGTYLFVGKEERDAIKANPDLNQTFELEGVTEDGTVNSAFRAFLQPGNDLIPIFRLRHSHQAGMYLFVGEEEHQSIFAADSPQKDNWISEGVDDEGNDIAEFYLYSSGSGLGASFERYRNVENGSYLYVTVTEGAAIRSNPDLAEIFIYEGGAFESII